ncbi:MAG: tRNA (adenosine(37)-N6)-dimethylallyltransferase MiaA [bacterium]|nr:tRNA (adenosine(37)-N6)-dimethylallyltransferase MiaA [bacterium]
MPHKGQGPILIAGQTTSGKSGLALKLAHELDGVIVNADSMQIYEELQILSARPSKEEMQGLPHKLYGHIKARTPYSVGHWLLEIETTLNDIANEGKRAIIIGGTGLYFKALLEGLSPVPEIFDHFRDKWRQRALDPTYDLHARLKLDDPEMAERLMPSDRQRLARALEVINGTGKSLLYWQKQPNKGGLINADECVKLAIYVERADLYARCDQRFDEMISAGAIDEVSRLLDLQLPSTLPSMRALGVRPLAAFLAGDYSIKDAVEKAKTETRQYAKRQSTWLKSNMITWKSINLKEMQRKEVDLFSLI